VVNFTIHATVPAGIVGLRPPPGATFPRPGRPPASTEARHERTVTGVTPLTRALTVFAAPSAAASSTLARCTSRYAAVRDLAIVLNVCR
jgi:hypothetical protein